MPALVAIHQDASGKALDRALSYALAYLSWHMFEKHFLKLKAAFPMPSRAVAREGANTDE